MSSENIYNADPNNTDVNNIKKKLPFRIKAGYSVGQVGEALGISLYAMFFMFFLTDVVGIPAGVAGTISLIITLCDTLASPIIGNISDNLHSKKGRRRPMMIGILIPYSVCMFLLLNNIDMNSPMIVYVYFGLIGILFCVAYRIYAIPFYALGAELTDDFDERTSLRVWASTLSFLAIMLASAAPPMIVEMAKQAGGTESTGWRVVGGSFGIIIAAAIIICWLATRGGELVSKEAYAVEGKQNLVKNMIRDIGGVIKLKPIWMLAGSVIGWIIACSLIGSGLMYLMANALNYSAGLQSTGFMINSLAGIIWLPIINWAAGKFDKKKVYALSFLVTSIALILFYFIGFTHLALFIVFLVLYNFANSCYWTLTYAMYYDISELDEFKNGKRREGTIASLMAFAEGIGTAIGMWLIGQILEFGNYDGMAATQTESAIDAIYAINTWVPGLFGLFALICALAYPISRSRFNALVKALQLKRDGKKYTTDGFEKLL